jgi:hypothetical protein
MSNDDAGLKIVILLCLAIVICYLVFAMSFLLWLHFHRVELRYQLQRDDLEQNVYRPLRAHAAAEAVATMAATAA